MATDLERLVLTLEARMRTYERELDKARGHTNKSLKAIESRFGRTEAFLSNFAKGFAGAFLSAFSVTAIVKGATDAAAALDKLGKSARTVGLDTDTFQTLQFAALEEGVKGLDTALEQFTARSGEAAQGQGEFYKKLREINPAIAEQIRLAKDQESRLRVVADAVKNATTAEEKAVIAKAAFGRAGVEMVRILNNGSEGLDDFGRRARDLGIIVERDLIAKAEELNNKMDVARKVIGVEMQRALIQIMPLLIRFTQEIGRAAKAVNFIIDSTRDFGERSTSSLESRLNQLREVLVELDKGTTVNNPFFNRAVVLKEIADIEAELDKRRTRITVNPEGPARRLGPREDADAFEKEIERIQKRIALIDAETASIDQGAAARARARVVAELETAAKKANAEAGRDGTVVTDEQRKKIEELADAYLKVAHASEAASGPLRTFAREARDVGKELEQATVGSLRSIEDAFVDIIAGTGNVKEAFSRMAQSIAQDLARIAVRQAITGPIASLLGGFGGVGGFGGGIRLPGFAAGTSFAPGGLAVVGERGPELVRLPRGSQVIPNNVVSQMGGGSSTSVVIQQHNTFNGADPASEARMRAALGVVKNQAVAEAVAAVSRVRRNTPGYLRI